MEHRREPMGGEVDSDHVIGSDWTNNNDTVDSNHQSPDSFSSDHFVDDLTLKVRSLLSNWDECELHGHLQPQLQRNLPQLQGNLPQLQRNQLQFQEIQPHVSSAVDPRHHFDANAMSKSRAQAGSRFLTHRQAAVTDNPAKVTTSGFQTKVSSQQGPSDCSAKPGDFHNLADSLSQTSINRSRQLPKIIINKNERANLYLKTSKPSAQNPLEIHPCVSYDDFSNSLPDANDILGRNRPLEQEACFSVQYKHSNKKSCIYIGGTEQTSGNDPSQGYFSHPATSTHLDIRHESLENEAERSWSEITMRAESFMQPCDENKEDLPEQDVSQGFFPGGGSKLKNTITDGFISTNRPIGVNTIDSNRISDDLIDLNTSSDRCVIGSNITDNNVPLNPMTSNTVEDNKRMSAGLIVLNTSYSASSTSADRHVVGSNIADSNARLNPVISNASKVSLTTNTKFSVASGSVSPVDFNSKHKGGLDARSAISPFNPTSNNESLSTVDFNTSPKNGVTRDSRFGDGDTVNNNLMGFNTALKNSLTSDSRVKTVTSLNSGDINAEHEDNSDAFRLDMQNNERGNAFRSGIPNDDRDANLIEFNPVPRESSSRSSNAVGYAASSRASMDDWRINLFNPDRNPLRDPEGNYPPFSSPSDFDPMERETPPLSASSMASSRRLEWDNLADIGYGVAILNPNFRMIPEMARSDPEGISLMNETLNVVPSPMSFPYFSLQSSAGDSYGASRVASSQASSVGNPDDDPLDSSSGSLTRSDSKKSVIYNSVRDMRRHSKAQSSKANGTHSHQPFRNRSCPDLADLRESCAKQDWANENLSKSEEQVGTRKEMATFLFPGLATQRPKSFLLNKTSSSQMVSQQSSVGVEDVYGRGDVLFAVHKENMPHACTTCQAPLNFAGDQMTSYSISQTPGDAEFGSEEVNYDPIYDIAHVSQDHAIVEWVDEANTDLRYVAEFSDDYPHSRPVLVVSDSRSKSTGGNLSKIVGSFFSNSASDHSASGHAGIKPHIRWYPFKPSMTEQDIKDVSTQTSVSFVAKQTQDTPAQAVFGQQTSSPEDIVLELNPGHAGFSERRKIAHGESGDVSEISTLAKSIRQDNDIYHPELSFQPSRFVNPETGFFSSEDDHQGSKEGINNERASVNMSASQTCRSCHTNLNIASDGSVYEQHLLTVANNSNTDLRLVTCTTSGNLFGDAEVELMNNTSAPTGERKLGVGECQTIPKTLHGDSDTDHEDNKSGMDSRTLPKRAPFPFTSSHASMRMNTSLHENVPVQCSSNVKNVAIAFNQPSNQEDSKNVPISSQDFHHNFATTTASALKTLQESILTRPQTVTPGANSVQSQITSRNNIGDLNIVRSQTVMHGANSVQSQMTSRNNIGDTNLIRPQTVVPGANSVQSQVAFHNNIGNSNIVRQDNRTMIPGANFPQNQTTSHKTGNSSLTRPQTVLPGMNSTQSKTTSHIKTVDSNNLKNSQQNFPQNLFAATSTNLLDFLSQHRPFSDSKYREQREGIPKSYSDPLITGQDQDASSEESDDSVPCQSKVREDTLEYSTSASPAVGTDEKLKHNVVYQEYPNSSQTVEDLGFCRVPNVTSNRTEKSASPPNWLFCQKESVESQHDFIGRDHLQVSHAKLTTKEIKSLSEHLALNPSSEQRKVLYNKLSSENIQRLKQALSALSQGDNLSDFVNTSRKRNGAAELRHPTSCQTSVNVRNDNDSPPALNSMQKRSRVAQMPAKTIYPTPDTSQFQENSERQSQMHPQFGGISYMSPSSSSRNVRDEQVNAQIGNDVRKSSSSQVGGVFDVEMSSTQQPTTSVHVQAQYEIDDKSTQTSYLQFQDNPSGENDPRARLGNQMYPSLSPTLYNARNEDAQTGYLASSTRLVKNFDSSRSLANQQLHAGLLDISNNEANLLQEVNQSLSTQTGINIREPSNQCQDDISRLTQSKLVSNSVARRESQSFNTGNRSTQAHIEFNNITPSFNQLQGNISKQRSLSYSLTHPEYAKRDLLETNRDFTSLGTLASAGSLPDHEKSPGSNILTKTIDKSLSSNQFQESSKQRSPSHRLAHHYSDYANTISKQNHPKSKSESDILTHSNKDLTKRDPLAANRFFISTGTQVSSSRSLLETEKCSFCHRSKSSHLSRCPEKDAFKAVLDRALERGRRGVLGGTSFCVFSKVCFCCCNKTLQEAFNYHRSEIVERIEARQKEVDAKTGKSLLLNLPLPVVSHHRNSKIKSKPVSAKPITTSKPQSNKENIKKGTRNYTAPSTNFSKQRNRLKNLNKYNRVMSKIYSQRLKSEILRGKVNFHRHEILMNS